MLHIEDGQLRSMTMENIDILIQKLNNEKVRRQQIEEDEAIEDFHKAFNRLHELGVILYYKNEFYNDPIYLEEWNGFGLNS